ncbi:hypothetical protein BGW80DRAFT_1163751 [Lactifluus volemus]|nr:hypothetical protein BGW80DRAFT_1163751 [Lactifluus volemus]
MSRSFFAIVLFSFLALAQAVVLVKNDVEDVITVHITEPHADTIWSAGSFKMVKWDLPTFHYDHNSTAKIYLGYLEGNNEHLCLHNPLATKVLVSAGKVQVKVPNVPFGKDYVVVFYGDTGDRSPPFTIIGGTGGHRHGCNLEP